MLILKPGQALSLWLNSMLAQVRDDDPDLTTRQMAILLTIYLDPAPHTVRGLAAHLGVTKPVITRALDTMGAKVKQGLKHSKLAFCQAIVLEVFVYINSYSFNSTV